MVTTINNNDIQIVPNDKLFDLTGEVAVVTGAASGLGADAARAYVTAGASVALLDVNEQGLATVADELNALGGHVIAIPTDVSVDEQVRDAIGKARGELGEIGVVLNDAGAYARDSAETFTDEEWDHVFAVNLKSILLTTRYVIDGFKKRGYGKIVNIASIDALIAGTGETWVRDSYHSSKAAVIGLTRTLGIRYAKYGVNVNAIAPGLFRTGLSANNFEAEGFAERFSAHNPSRRYGRPGELNGTVLYLSSHASDYVQAQTIVVDGGTTVGYAE